MSFCAFLAQTKQFLGSLAFTFLLTVFTIFYAPFCVAAFPLPLRFRYQIIVFYTTCVLHALKWLCGIDWHIQGLDNIPRDRVGVVLCKHQSTWETFLLQGLFPGSAIVLKRELLFVPFFGWGLAIIAPIAINRGDRRKAMQDMLKQGKNCLDQGRWIVMYPEGTRIAPGKVGQYRLGGARIAVAAGYPVLPIAHNAGYFWPKRGFLKKSGTVQVVIGPLIDTNGKTPEAVMEEAKTWIENTILTLPAPNQKTRGYFSD